MHKRRKVHDAKLRLGLSQNKRSQPQLYVTVVREKGGKDCNKNVGQVEVEDVLIELITKKTKNTILLKGIKYGHDHGKMLYYRFRCTSRLSFYTLHFLTSHPQYTLVSKKCSLLALPNVEDGIGGRSNFLMIKIIPPRRAALSSKPGLCFCLDVQ